MTVFLFGTEFANSGQLTFKFKLHGNINETQRLDWNIIRNVQ